MKIDLHNHTKRCNHATGEMKEYVEAAIAAGVGIFGFADHAPMGFDKAYRMGLEEVDSYLAEARELRENYRGNIDIRVGFEVDYIAGREALLERRILDAEVDFLVGSVHFLNNWGFDNEAFLGEYAGKNMDLVWEEYLAAIALMAGSGHFDIVGHFDLLKIFNNPPSARVKPHISRALGAIKKSKMALEINAAGLRKKCGEIYPSEEILREAYALEIPITFSSDAHAPSQVGFGSDEAANLARRVGFKSAVAFKARKMEEYGL